MEPDLSGLRILVVDDNPDNQLLISRFLELSHAQVDIANSGTAALEFISKTPVDAVLMDIQMPDMDGYEATRHLRERGFRKPILALTAHAMNHERTQMIDAGCNDHVAKPVDRKTLTNVLLKYCRPMDREAARFV